MQRAPILLSHVVVKFLTLAITVVVGFQVGPRVSARDSSVPVVRCTEQKASEDTVKVGQRVEPRVFPAPFLDRFSPVHPFCRPGAVSLADEALAFGAAVSEDRSRRDRLPIVKHVPRMERGDPPRA
jgi:hypothetical protein